MTLRYIIRPEGIQTTPKMLADDLGVQTRKWPGFESDKADWKQDLFLIYPSADYVKNADTHYARLRSFFSLDKANQRITLGSAGIPIPQTFVKKADLISASLTSSKFVVRPLHHSGGNDYRVTMNPLDFIEGQEYISALFPKDREYRILFAFGQPVVFWQKKGPDGAGVEDAWGGEGGKFILINDWQNSYLKLHTDAFAKLQALPIIQNAHIVGVDIMYDTKTKKWVVCEFNVCPSLQWGETTRGIVVKAIQAHFPAAPAPVQQQPQQQTLAQYSANVVTTHSNIPFAVKGQQHQFTKQELAVLAIDAILAYQNA